MALTQEAINDAKLAEAKITSSTTLSEDYKKNLLNLVSISTMATNGISQEEKIQLMTDAIRILAISQVDFITSIRKTIVDTITEQNKTLCLNCKAMAHAKDVEDKALIERLHQQWIAAEKAKNPLTVDIKSNEQKVTETNDTWKNIISIIKDAVNQPGLWIVLTCLTLSPYGIDIIKFLVNTFAK